MKIEPRQQIRDIWQATVAASYDRKSRSWRWGGRRGANSISDGEQLLCILLPASELPVFRLDRPGSTDATVAAALRDLGSPTEIALSLVRGVTEYLTRYRRPDGTPAFGGGGYFVAPDGTEPTAKQLELDVVESFAVSIQLCLAALGFAKILHESVTREEIEAELKTMESLARTRLTAAMVGLLRSFAINVFRPDEPYGQALLRTVNQEQRAESEVLTELREELREIAARLRDLDVGNEQPKELENEDLLFECGWTWGIAVDAPLVDHAGDLAQHPGYALAAPYLYSTVVALDGIAELDSDRTRVLNLLDEDQLRMASALRLRWDLTQAYWATIASFGRGRWPLEDIPWRTTDDEESDFFTLLVTSIAARELTLRRATDESLGRLGAVLTELANRARVTRRPLRHDPAIAMHYPGVEMQLAGSELDTDVQLSWVGTDFAPLLLKRALQIAELVRDIDVRSRLLNLTDEVWTHILRRRIRSGPNKGLWDQPQNVFDEIDADLTEVSWHHTMRVIESLVIAARLTSSDPLRGTRLLALGSELLVEAQHRYDWEILQGSGETRNRLSADLNEIGGELDRAREIMNEAPGSAVARLLQVLYQLDGLAAARRRSDGSLL